VAQQTKEISNSVLAKGDWYKISIPISGVYKLTYSDFISLGVPASAIKSANLSIYGNGGHQISSNNSLCKSTDLIENAIYVYDPYNDLSKGGYVLFYGEGTTVYSYDNDTRLWSASVHPYSDNAYYFVTFTDSIGQKLRVDSISYETITADTTTNITRDFFFYKQELNNVSSSGNRWVGKALTIDKEESYPLDLKNAYVTSNNNLVREATLSCKFVSQSTANSTFDIAFNNSISYTETNSVSSSVTEAQITDKTYTTPITSVNTVDNRLKLTFHGNSVAKGWLDCIMVSYDKLLYYNYPSQLHYRTTEYLATNNNVRNVIANVAADNVFVWDVSSYTAPVRVIGSYNSTSKTYSFNLNASAMKDIVVFQPTSSFNSVKIIGKIDNQDLHSTPAVDYVIITAPEFLEQAKRLASLHQTYNNTSTQVVTTTQVYNEFSSGEPDFLAYKEYLRYLYNEYSPQGKAPKNVLLFGKGTFDNKNILGYNNNFVLTHQGDNNLSSQYTYPCEDYVAYLSPWAKGYSSISQRDTMLVGVGRLPASTVAQAEILVSKSERYLKRQDIREHSGINDWRNTMVLTCDDSDNGGAFFISHAEHLYEEAKQEQPELNAIKIYSDAYKQYSSSVGSTYPDASKAINNQMKKGCLIFNYVGHGSEDHLSSERLITITDITGWENYNQMPIMITSTCEFARYDLVDKISAGEYTILSSKGGMIGLISASRKIISEDAINRAFHRYLLEKIDGNKTRTFGQGYATTKNDKTFSTSEDKRCVLLLGDPALRISTPMYNVVTSSINGTDPALQNDTIKALSTVTINGKITDADSATVTSFNGTLQITVFDKSSNYYTLDNENDGSAIEFEQQKNILYKGNAKVENGCFTHSFTLPKDIAYNYGFGKISYYAQADSTDAGGYCNSFVIGGIDTNANVWETRPNIRLFMGDSNFVSGGITATAANMFAIISDSIAINTVGSGLGHDITATLDNAANTFILNDYFVQDENNPNCGYITYPFTELANGEHTLTLKVWNIFNYSSSATITFNVIDESTKTFTNLKNYPNPFHSETRFYIEHNQPSNINYAQIEVYSLTGQRVKTIKANNLSQTGFTLGPIEWDGTNDNGAKLKAGIYAYRVLFNTSTGDTYSQTEKLVIF